MKEAAGFQDSKVFAGRADAAARRSARGGPLPAGELPAERLEHLGRLPALGPGGGDDLGEKRPGKRDRAPEPPVGQFRVLLVGRCLDTKHS